MLLESQTVMPSIVLGCYAVAFGLWLSMLLQQRRDQRSAQSARHRIRMAPPLVSGSGARTQAMCGVLGAALAEAQASINGAHSVYDDSTLDDAHAAYATPQPPSAGAQPWAGILSEPIINGMQ